MEVEAEDEAAGQRKNDKKVLLVVAVAGGRAWWKRDPGRGFISSRERPYLLGQGLLGQRRLAPE
jgi:hypothetical protein